jgi:AraC-like DNA-binding protein
VVWVAAYLDAERLDGAALPSRYHDYERDEHTAHLGRRLITHLRRPPINRLYVEGLALATIGATMSRINCTSAPLVSGEDVRIARVIDYVEAHYGEALAVAELAAVAAMSPSYFSKCFKAQMNEPVWAYVQRRRCERAREQLITTREPIAHIAYACGFANQGHLTSVFKKMFGVTPGQSRGI